MIGGLHTTPGDYIVLIYPQFTCNIYLWLMHVLERTFFSKKFNEGCSCIKNNRNFSIHASVTKFSVFDAKERTL